MKVIHMDEENTNIEQAAEAPSSARGRQIVGARFQTAGKSYHFAAAPDMALKVGEWIVVETMFGEQVGQITETNITPSKSGGTRNLRPVLRCASGLDMARYRLMEERGQRMVEVAREEVKNNNYDLKIISAEYTLDGTSALVQCIGNAGKKELGNLRHRLSSRMNCRVELREVGPRDHAKCLDGYGVCGERRCCSRFLTEFQTVSIRMAKEQAISMSPSDITGMCGRLRCCLAYEHEVYMEEAKSLPRLKSRVQTEKGVGRVIDLDILNGDVIVEIPPDGPRRERQHFRFAVEDVEVVQSTEGPKQS